MTRLLTWILAACKGAWLSLRHWRRQCNAEDATGRLGKFAIDEAMVRLARELPETNPAMADVSGERRGGGIAKRNIHTVWFQLYDGRTIKRHIRKHFVIETAW